jgi:hypothetical protein
MKWHDICLVLNAINHSIKLFENFAIFVHWIVLSKVARSNKWSGFYSSNKQWRGALDGEVIRILQLEHSSVFRLWSTTGSNKPVVSYTLTRADFDCTIEMCFQLTDEWLLPIDHNSHFDYGSIRCFWRFVFYWWFVSIFCHLLLVVLREWRVLFISSTLDLFWIRFVCLSSSFACRSKGGEGCLNHDSVTQSN